MTHMYSFSDVAIYLPCNYDPAQQGLLLREISFLRSKDKIVLLA